MAMSPASLEMTVTAHVLDSDSDAGGDDTSSVSTQFTLTVDPEADEVTFTAGSASGAEDSWIDLNSSFQLSDTDGSESVSSVTLSGIPDGAELQLADGTAITVTGGSAEIPMSAVTGDGESYSLDGVQVKPPADSNENFALGIDVTTVDSNGVTSDSQQTSGTISVEVASVADEATIDAGDITATEDAGAIALNLDAAVGDTDGSESITAIDISGVPDTVQLSAGTDNGDGSWSLTPDQLQGLTATVDGDVSGVFDMSVTAHVLDADSDSGGDDTIATTKDFTLTINPEADGVSITEAAPAAMRMSGLR
uniref:Uncharacterized protein n=1 Tax=Magnetococcus massalia (strain MO-1) TaxID=451514 RepID=A0A1S7LR57_MAGMO|nr:protein of unknown function [Candidatus Magnetococcus massalia]